MIIRWWCVHKNKQLEARQAELGDTNPWRYVL